MNKNKDRIEIFLVPGFLGFNFLGDLDYFLDVKQVLERRLAERNLEAVVHALGTDVPAGSVRRRAAYMVKEAAKMHCQEVKSVHFVGHSTGGLDIRMMLSPGGAIDTGRDFTKDPHSDEGVYLTPAVRQNLPDLIKKIESATSVATPHRGTPIANFAMRFAADRLLRGIHHCSERPLPEFILKEGLAFTSCVTKPLLFVPYGRSNPALQPRLPRAAAARVPSQGGARDRGLRHQADQAVPLRDLLSQLDRRHHPVRGSRQSRAIRPAGR